MVKRDNSGPFDPLRKGFQGALTAPVFQALAESFGCCFEGFALAPRMAGRTKITGNVPCNRTKLLKRERISLLA